MATFFGRAGISDVFFGGAGNDIADGYRSLSGTPFEIPDTIDLGDDPAGGGAGDGDDLFGADGADVLYGGGGNDSLIGGPGNDTAFGGDGEDVVLYFVGGGSDSVDGGAGNDTFIVGSVSTVLVEDGATNGTIAADHVAVTVDGALSDLDNVETVFVQPTNNGTVTILGDFSATDISPTTFEFAGNLGDETLDASGLTSAHSVIIVPSAFGGNDTLTGGAGDDSLTEGVGDDILEGGAGDDLLDGGADNDMLDGGAGNDTLIGGDGDDQVFWSSGEGSDSIDGGAGNDTALVIGDNTLGDVFEITEAGGLVIVDQLAPGAATLTIDGVEELVVNGAGGDDSVTISGDFSATDISPTTFVLDGEDGEDTLDARTLTSAHSVEASGGANDDMIFAGRGDDSLNGGLGNDRMFGGRGDDEISGFAGTDFMRGGDGDDRFLFSVVAGDDMIKDFKAGAGSVDVLDYSNQAISFGDLSIADNMAGNAVVTNTVTGDTVELLGVATADLDPTDDFAF